MWQSELLEICQSYSGEWSFFGQEWARSVPKGDGEDAVVLINNTQEWSRYTEKFKAGQDVNFHTASALWEHYTHTEGIVEKSCQQYLQMYRTTISQKDPFPKTISETCHVLSKWKNQYGSKYNNLLSKPRSKIPVWMLWYFIHILSCPHTIVSLCANF